MKIGGKQYRVAKGSVIEVDSLGIEKDRKIELDYVLLTVKAGKAEIGKPKVKDAKVEAKILNHKKGNKIRIAKFRAKSRYRRAMGFRPMLTRLQIEDIVLSKRL